MSQQTSAVSIKGLKKSFKDLKVLKGINLEVPRGSMLALLGPNGAGKTTIVRILSTLLKADEGELFIEGINVREDPEKVRHVIGLTGQYAAVDEYLNGRENLEMMGRLYHLSKADAKRRAQELLEQFDLVKAAERSSKTYSGGMRRRLDLAASLIATPPIIFLDEPTTGLDPRSRIAMWDVIRKLMNEGTTILLTTQYLEEADQLADKIAVINDGKIVANGTANELKKTVGNDRIEFTMASSADFKKAQQALKGEDMHVTAESNTVAVGSSDGTKQLYNLLGRLNDAKINIDNMSIHKPTLDDVFLKLTGKPTDASKADEKETK
ncbi:MAG TPA: ATP-binding cassette domain-containing protein [Candidatus Saccharimonadales bacterium]